MLTPLQIALKMYVRQRMSFQDMRKTVDNRRGKKANGQDKGGILHDITILPKDVKNLELISQNAKEQEGVIEDMIKECLKNFPIWNEWLKNVKGIGTIGAGWCLAEFDIEKATTVSKMWQYAGYNPSMVIGKKRVEKGKYKNEMGEIIEEIHSKKNGVNSISYVVLTNTEIRGDKQTPGFLRPYNKRLRTALYGTVACAFLKAVGSEYGKIYYNFYVPEKYRKDQAEMKKRPDLAGRFGVYDISEKVTREMKAGGKIEYKPWKDCTKAHRSAAAIRKMMKQFLTDLYVNWRTIDGLPVRPPYSEEKLGHVHSGK